MRWKGALEGLPAEGLMTRLGEAAKVSPVTTSTHLSGRPPTGAGQGGVWRREEEKLRTVPLSLTEIRQRGSHPAHPHPHRQCVSVRSWRRRRAPAFLRLCGGSEPVESKKNCAG